MYTMYHSQITKVTVNKGLNQAILFLMERVCGLLVREGEWIMTARERQSTKG